MDWLFNPYLLMAALMLAYLATDPGEPMAPA